MANPSLDALLKAIGKQGVRTAGQNVGQARTQTPLSDDRWAKFEAARKAPKKTGGGGLGGFFGKALSIIDLPRAVITSGVKEITDAFQGEGFNFGEFIDQTKNHYGFGDFIRDENINLGKWGNRIVGFIGDVALDPLTYAGGLGVYSRARGARGLVDDLAPLRKDLQKLGVRTAGQQAELQAVDTAIKAAGRKGGSVSRARNALADLNTPQASKLIDDLGIQTGLRMRAPGTGPVLGKLTRGSESLARRRAKQLPELTQRRLKELGVEGDDLTDLVRRAGRGKKSAKGLREVADTLPAEVKQIVSRAAKMPVEFTPMSTMPMGGRVSASIMKAPGIGFEKMATSKIGKSFKKAFVDEETQFLNKLRRGDSPEKIGALKKIRDTGFRRAAQEMVKSTDVDDILVSNFFQNAQKRGSGMSGSWSDTATRNRRSFVNDIQQNVGRVKDDVLGRVTELPSELADDILSGKGIPDFVERRLRQQFPSLKTEDIGYIIRSYDNRVRKPDIEFLGRPDLYGRTVDEVDLGVRNPLMEDFDAVLNDYGGYTTQNVSSKGKQIFKASNTSELEQVLEEGVPTATNRYQVKGRYVTKSNKPRKNVPSSLWDDGTVREGRVITIPRRDGGGNVTVTLKRPYAAQSSVDSYRTIKEVPDGIGGIKTTVVDEPMAGSKEFAKRQAYEQKVASGEIGMQGRMDDVFGRSIPDQVDDAYRKAGWLDEGESMYERGFQKREDAYVGERAKGVRQDAIEDYAAKQGLIINAETAQAYARTVEGLADDAAIFAEELAKLPPDKIAKRLAEESLQRMGVALKGSGSEDAFDNFIVSLGDEGPAVKKGIEDAVRQGEDAIVESFELQDELLEIRGDMQNLLKSKGIDFDLETGAGKFAIDAVRELTPLVEDMTKIMARERLLEEGNAKIRKLIQSLSEINGSEDVVVGLRGLATQLDDFQKEISDVLIPGIRDLTEDVMMKDKSIVALEEMLGAAKTAAGGLDASMKRQAFKPIQGLSPQANKVLKTFTNQMSEIGELEDVLQFNLLSNKGENLPTMMKRLQDTSQKMVDEATQIWGTKAGSRLAAILAPEDIVGAAAATNIRRNIGQSFGDLTDTFDSFSPVQTQVRQTTEVITPQMDEIIEAGFREVPNVPDPSSEQFGPWLEDTFRSTPTGQTTGWESKELVNLNDMIKNYDTQGVPLGETASVNKITSKLEKSPVAQASFVAREALSNAWDNAIGVMERNIEQLNLEKRALMQTPESPRRASRLADIDNAVEAMSIKLQASIKGQEDNLMFYKGLEGTNKRFEDAFNLNNYGGDFNLNGVTAEQMMDMWNSSGDQVWGGWRVGGDQRTFDQFKEGMLATQKMNDVREVGAFLRQYDKMHNWLKAQMVATPGFVLRNLMGGMANMWFADIPLSETLGAGNLLKRAYKEGRGDLEAGLTGLIKKSPKDQELRNALDLVRLGAHGGGQAASSVDVNLGKSSWLDFVVGSKEAGAMNRKARIRLNPLDSGFALFAGVRHANSMAEGAMRLGTGLHAMRTGRNIDDAIGEIYKLHFDYGQLSKFEQSTAKRLIPFYTWTRNNLPLQMQLLAQNPKKFNRMMTIKRNMELGGPEDKNVADYMLEPYGFKLPFKINDSVTYFTPDLPLQDLIRMDPTAEGGKRALEQVVSGTTPFIKAPIEFWAKKKVFAGIPYQDKPVNFPVALRSIPGLKEAAKALGFADQNRRGDWLINDKHLGFIENMLPFISRFRRFIPEDKKTQDGWLRTMLSSGAGLSVKINTPRLQRSEVIRRRIRRADERSKKRAWRDTIV